MLTIQEYNQNEIKGKIGLSNRFIRAFRAGAFEIGGFPTVVFNEQELVRYIDSQHGECYEKYYFELCEGLSQDEYYSVLNITEKIYNYTVNIYDKEFLVKAPVLDAIYCKRLIMAAIEKTDDICVMEIGAGSGILGAILLADNLKYICTDVTQAFYLMQNRLLSVFCDGIDEYAYAEERIPNARCIHIPYWKLWDIRNKEGQVDVFTCNHALLEMHTNAVRFYLKIAKNLMKNSKEGYFVIRSFGWSVERSIEDVLEDFEMEGYKLKYFDYNKQVAIYRLYGESVYENVKELLSSPDYVNREEYKIYRLGVKQKKEIVNGIVYTSGEGKRIWSKLINDKREINIDKLNRGYDKITCNQDSPDEEFGKYVRINYEK